MGVKLTKLINNWQGVKFEGGSTKTPEFKLFARDFKLAIKEMVMPDWKLDRFQVGHFYVSGFLKNMDDGRYVYFSISDVRHFQDAWVNGVLIRTAKNNTDYTGGGNRYTGIETFKEGVDKL